MRGSPSRLQKERASQPQTRFIHSCFMTRLVECLKRQKYKSTVRDAGIHMTRNFVGYEESRSMQPWLTGNLLFCKLVSLKIQEPAFSVDAKGQAKFPVP